ncbi:hypothetical protein TH47_03870 [Thalassospira sp. MCCC 1A02803]|jgi:hypothetical protein|nr:hypothetical protein TH47_03870 [Thalassospira sp. MCCC 1A02803]
MALFGKIIPVHHQDGKIWSGFGHDKRQFCTNSFHQRMNVQIIETTIGNAVKSSF